MATLEKLYHALSAAALTGALAGILAGAVACSSLTQPPAPEAVASTAPADAGAPARVDAQAPAPQASAAPNPPPPAAPATITSVTVKPGKGPGAQKGDTVSVHYTGTLTDGSKFDSSLDRKTPFEFTLGNNMVIQGWEQGILGMKVGEKRKLTIPPSLAYGPRARPGIPANSTLVFDVELLAIKPAPKK
jgi:FKBP-type peptidyl-prolyl cis-trans isomerase